MRGTYTHDFDQLEKIVPLIQEIIPSELFVFANKAQAVELGEGFKFLLLPEEYPSDEKAYYSKLIYDVPDDTYFAVFMHGTIKSKAFLSKIIETEKDHPNHVVFDEKELKRISSTFVGCGHIHTHSITIGSLIYHGAFSRNSHLEVEKKGFLHYTINLENPQKWSYKLIENNLAPVYQSFTLEHILKSCSSPNEFIPVVESLFQSESSPINFLRIFYTQKFKDEQVAQFNTYIQLLKSSKYYDYITLQPTKKAIDEQIYLTDTSKGIVVDTVNKSKHETLQEMIKTTSENNQTEFELPMRLSALVTNNQLSEAVSLFLSEFTKSETTVTIDDINEWLDDGKEGDQ
jgi:hypothetical protein